MIDTPAITTTAEQPTAVIHLTIPRSEIQKEMGPAHQELFSTLARETGGSILPVGSDSDFAAAFRRILGEFRSAYVLYYTPRGVDARGYHTLEVKVKPTDARVQARRGYFGS